MKNTSSSEHETSERCHELDQLLVNLIERKQPPDMNVALINRGKKSVKYNVKNIQQKDSQQWSEFSPGVMLYFALLRYLTILFFVLFINALPSIIYNFSNKGLQIYHQNTASKMKIDFMRLSLANLPISSFTVNKVGESFAHRDTLLYDSQEVLKHTKNSRLFVCLNDLWISAICVAFFIIWQIKAKDMISNTMVENCHLPSYRTIVIYDVFDHDNIEHQLADLSSNNNSNDEPQKFAQKETQRDLTHQLQSQKIFEQSLTTEQKWELKIKQHFQKFAQVDSVAIVYDYGETLQQLSDFNRLAKRYSEESDTKSKGQLYDMLKVKFELIKKEYLQMTQSSMKRYGVPFLPKKAFVTFYNKEDRNRVKNLYKYRINPELLKFSLFNNNCSEKNNIKNDKILLPRIKKCHTQPISIKWQNFHHKRGEQVRATFFIGGFLCVVLFFALVAILLLSMEMAGLVDKTWHLEPQSTPNTNDPLIEHPTYEQALTTTNLQTLYNFCSSLQLSYTNFKFQYYTLCQDYFSSFSQKWLTMWMISGIIVTINLLLNFIISSLVDFRRHRTSTERSRFLIVNIFLVYFTNMVLILLLIRADFSPSVSTEHSLVHLIKSIFPGFQSHKKVETYPEFNRKWYIHIGNQLMFNYMVSLIISPWFYVLMYWFFDRMKYLIVKFERFSRHQQQLNEILLAQQFDFQTYYAMVICSFYFSLTFAAAMPMFYLLAAVSFLSLYLSTRLIFYKFCRVPQPFDHSINTLVSKMLMFGLGVHQLSTIFFLYTQDIFPSAQSILSTNDRTTTFSQKLGQGWIYVCMFILVMIIHWFKKQIAVIINKKYLQMRKQRELNEQNMMKEIGVNIPQDVLAEEIDVAGGMVMGSQENRCIDIQATKNPSKISSRSLQQQNLSSLGNINNLDSQLSQRYYYRMQDNPLYSNIHYILTVFHKIAYTTSFYSHTKIELPQLDKDLASNNEQEKIQQLATQIHEIVE